MGRVAFISILINLLSVCCFSLSAQQELYTKSKKALKFYGEARRNFDKRNDKEALDFLNKAIRADRKFIEAWFMKAQIQKDQLDFQGAIESFRKGLSVNPTWFPEGFYILAREEYAQGLYHDAFTSISRYLELGSSERLSGLEVKAFIEKCAYAVTLIENPVLFKPVNLGDSVNSPLNEYWPSLSLDEKAMIFTVLEPIDPSKPIGFGNRQEDFYKSMKDNNGIWGRRRNLGAPVNTSDNEGAQSISADGRFLFFTGCNRPDGYGMCDIYVSRKDGDKWSVPRNAGSLINTAYSEKHPSVSADGRVLFFSSDRPGGKGKLDIYRSTCNERGEWSVPENLGDHINTPGNEQSPFIHPDGRTLYFTSEGHLNLGQSDIFFSRFTENEGWSIPLNLGYPINTHNNELGLIVNPAGDMAYYASDRHSEKDLDIYKFELHAEVRPDPVSYMKGRVFDSLTYKGLDAVFRLIDLQTGEMVIESVSAPGEGDFLVPLPSGRSYALNVSKTGYLFYSAHFSFHGVYERAEPFVKDVPLQPLRAGRKIVLNNIFFGFDQSALLPESEVELIKIYEFLDQNPKLRVQFNGHTDNVGTLEYNEHLSERRALSVANWLTGKGIDPARIKHKGFGASIPVASNETEEGRALNRRTEMQIVE